MMEAKIRKPAVAGSFYAGDAKELRQDVQNCFSRCKNPLMENVQAESYLMPATCSLG